MASSEHQGSNSTSNSPPLPPQPPPLPQQQATTAPQSATNQANNGCVYHTVLFTCTNIKHAHQHPIPSKDLRPLDICDTFLDEVANAARFRLGAPCPSVLDPIVRDVLRQPKYAWERDWQGQISKWNPLCNGNRGHVKAQRKEQTRPWKYEQCNWHTEVDEQLITQVLLGKVVYEVWRERELKKKIE